MNALSINEKSDLKTCEQVIDANMNAITEVAWAIRRIRDGRLYREQYGTFAEYVEQRWRRARTWAYRLISAAETIECVAKNATTTVATPNRAQAEVLAGVPEEARGEVWGDYTQSTNRPTADGLRDFVAAKFAACPNCGGSEFAEDAGGRYCAACKEAIVDVPSPAAKPARRDDPVAAPDVCVLLKDAVRKAIDAVNKRWAPHPAVIAGVLEQVANEWREK